MNPKIAELVAHIQELQDELDREIVKRRADFGLNLSGKFIAFEKEALTRQKALRLGIMAFLAGADLATLLTAPVIYAMILPIALLDIAVTIYQQVCFRAYNIARVRRADFIAMDRHSLSYLNWIEALNCAYCAYGNGVFAYAREIASRTEQYWCPIKHALRIRDPHQRYFEFVEYGDADGYRARLAEYRKRLEAN
jgi:hypothetical protein